MSTKKWGESFLKSGLPLEHLTLTTLTALGWSCEPKWEYRRLNRDLQQSWFEVDLIAHSPWDTRGTLALLTECKYHDKQRFWFFLPCSTVDHQAQHSALSAGGDLEADSEVVHYGPYVPLSNPTSHTLIRLASQSVWGVTVSHAGMKEENAVQHALEQLAYAYVPFCLERIYHFCSDWPEAVLPAVVTTAKLFRLKPEMQRLDAIRQANSPHDVADEVPWTWCYYASHGRVLDHNHDEIDRWRNQHKDLRWRGLDHQLASLWSGVHWVLVATIDGLADAAKALHEAFVGLPKDFSRNKQLRATVEARVPNRRKKARRTKKGSG